MKILQITPTFYPSKFGGIKVVSYNIAQALSGHGHDVTIYTTDAEIGSHRLRVLDNYSNRNNFHVRYFKNISNLIAYKYRIFLPLGIFFMIRKEIKNFDIVHSHDFRSFQNIIINYYCKKNSIPYIIDAHGATSTILFNETGLKPGLRSLFDRFFGNKILKEATCVLAETKMGVEEYRNLGIKENKIFIISPPFPTDQFTQLPSKGEFKRKYGINNDKIILFLGRINIIKGIDFLINSFYLLSSEVDDIILVIVGPDDGYKSTLMNLINKLELNNKVIFTGFLDGNDKLSALVDASMLVQTSRYEQGAWAPFEAILCNTPIIVSSNSGAGEDVKKFDAGYLVEWGNKIELKEAMQRIINDPSDAKIKTQKAKEYIINNLSMNENVKLYEVVYSKCQNKY